MQSDRHPAYFTTAHCAYEALGATDGAVRRQVVSQGTKVVAAGAVVGIVVAFLSTRFLASLLYELKPFDSTAFAVMLVIGVVASDMPVRRASSVHPLEVLGSE